MLTRTFIPIQPDMVAWRGTMSLNSHHFPSPKRNWVFSSPQFNFNKIKACAIEDQATSYNYSNFCTDLT